MKQPPSAFEDIAPRLSGRQFQAPWEFACEGNAFGGRGWFQGKVEVTLSWPLNVVGETTFTQAWRYVLKTTGSLWKLYSLRYVAEGEFGITDSGA